MFKFSVKPKGDDKWDENPTKQEMWSGFNKVTESAKNGRLRKAKVAYAWDKHDNVVKIVVVFDSKEYDAAMDYLEEDHMQTEPLQPVKNANKLLDDIYEMLQTAVRSKEDKVMEQKRLEEMQVVEEATVTTSVVATSEEVEEAVATAPVNDVTAPVAEEVVTEKLAAGYRLIDVEETEPVAVETGEGHKGMRITGIASGLDTEAIINDILLSQIEKLKLKVEEQCKNVTSDDSGVIEAVLKEVESEESSGDTNTSDVRGLEEIKNVIMGDFDVKVPDVISKDVPAEMFECNSELREYVKNKVGDDVSLKVWSSLNSHGEIFIYFRYKGVGATETVLKQIRRERLLGNKTYLGFLKNFKKIDFTIIKSLYKVMDKLQDKLDEVDNAEAEGLTFYETYSAVINHVEKRLAKLSEVEKDNLDIKTHLIDGEEYVCIKGARKLERILSEVGSSFKKMDFLKELRYPEDGEKSLLKTEKGRAYDNRETGDTEHWYYIRKCPQILDSV